jgi:hypothetical protein
MNEVIDAEPRVTERAIATTNEVQAGPLAMAMQAMKAGMSIADMRGMLDLQKDWEANEARKAYVDAVAAFKLNPPTVYKDKDNLQYKSRYTSIGNLVNTVNTALSQHGLSANWTIDQTDQIKVTCTLTHRLGHSDSCSMKGPADTTGAKNALQQIKSTATYLKLATYEAITGIASSDGNADDDGNGSGPSNYDAAAALREWTIRAEAAINLDALGKTRKMAGAEFSAAKDIEGWNAFKLIVEMKRAALEGAKP